MHSQHRLEWLYNPTLEWQSLEHLVHTYDVGAKAEALLSACWLVLVSSAFLTPSLTAALQSRRLSAVPSHELGSMPACFMSRLQTSLYRSCGLPVGRAPSHSSPYSMSLGMRPAAMRRTWPSHLRHLLMRRVKRLGIPARWRTSTCGSGGGSCLAASPAQRM